MARAFQREFEKGIYLANAEALLRRIRRLGDDLESVMLIGHNPGLEELTIMLSGMADGTARERLGEKFPTGALAVIVADVERWDDVTPGAGRLTQLVRPKDLETA